jgi:hypothetical protein
VGVPLAEATTNAAVFDVLPPGFCSVTLKLAATCKSEEASVVVQADAVLQTVVRALPEIRIVEPGPGLDAAKFAPSTCSVKPPAAPAVTLDGNREEIAGFVLIVIAATPVRVVSAELVATKLKLFGVGADAGAW